MALTREAILKLKLDGFERANTLAKNLSISLRAAAMDSGALKVILSSMRQDFGPFVAQLSAATGAFTAQAHQAQIATSQIIQMAASGQRAGSQIQIGMRGATAAGQKFSTTIKIAGERSKKAAKQTKGEWGRASEALAQAAAGGFKIQSGLRRAGPAIAAVGAAAVGLISAFKRGENVNMIAESFGRLSGGTASATQRLEELRQVTGGTIKNVDLMRGANIMSAAQLDISGEAFGQAAKAAVLLGRATGINAADAYNRLTLAMAKQEPEMLDEIGIKIDLTRALKLEADRRGVVVSSLGAQTRGQIFANAVVAQAKERSKALGIDLEKNIPVTQKLTVAWGNMLDKFSQMIVANPIIIDSFKAMGEAAIRLFNVLAPVLELLASIVAVAANVVGGVVGGIFGHAAFSDTGIVLPNVEPSVATPSGGDLASTLRSDDVERRVSDAIEERDRAFIDALESTQSNLSRQISLAGM